MGVRSSDSMLDVTATIEGDAAAAPRLDAVALPAGTRLGRYRVLEPIGHGGMSVVYRGHDPELDRWVAIKVLLNERGRAPDPGRRRRMLREARAAAAITHPNVVRVFDLGVADELTYIAMELVPQNLDQWIEGAQPRWQALVDKYVDVGRGLAAAHDQGILHRDFKPSNVLVGPDGRARVADFGLATKLGMSTATDPGSTRGEHPLDTAADARD